MLSNAYFLAKFRFDTAENEPAKNLQNFRKMHFRKCIFEKCMSTCAARRRTKLSRLEVYDMDEAFLLDVELICTQEGGYEASAASRREKRKSSASTACTAKCCSFSAVSAPIFATKYAFCSIFQNLPDIFFFARTGLPDYIRLSN